MTEIITAEGDRAMEAVGAAIGRAMGARGVIYLRGDLGAGKTTLSLIEWPEKGEGVLPRPDMTITITATDTGRRLAIEGQSAHGLSACRQLQTQDDALT